MEINGRIEVDESCDYCWNEYSVLTRDIRIVDGLVVCDECKRPINAKFNIVLFNPEHEQDNNINQDLI